ncbi:uncharacterized protein LOC113226761 [Hyposmocoma kahamanoa]|uniref:uncharacterized protein LOC113226761 n=1 Tax=Hyposmocoma kahamanoa TaxID=1477025 RepID=UPI000E6D7A9C|nr:uncharacterized protein LOC113226761 [Hyposmocoma kahamanoa]
MGAKQSKRSVDISGKEAEGAGEVAAGAGGEGRVEALADADALKPQLNGDAHIHEQTDKEKQLDSGTPENEKDATTEKEAKEQDNESDKEKEASPVTNGDTEAKAEIGDSSPAPEESKKPKKEKVKKKWSLRSISFSRKDKPKQEKKQKEEEPKTNGEPEKVPEEASEATPDNATNEVAEEALPKTEVKDEKTPETPVTEPLTNGSSTPEEPKAASLVPEEPAPVAASVPAPTAAALIPTPAPAVAEPIAPTPAPAEPESAKPEPKAESEPEQLPVNGLSLEISEAVQTNDSKPEPAAVASETVPAPEIPVKKEQAEDIDRSEVTTVDSALLNSNIAVEDEENVIEKEDVEIQGIQDENQKQIKDESDLESPVSFECDKILETPALPKETMDSIDDLPPPPPLDNEFTDISADVPSVTANEIKEVIVKPDHISNNVEVNGVSSEILNGNEDVDHQNLKNKNKNLIDNAKENFESNGNVEEVTTEATIEKKASEITEEKVITPEESLPPSLSEASEAAGSELSDAFPPPPAELCAPAEPPPHANDTPQEPLPVSDKLADLIPEVPVVPDLNTETLQETTTDVTVAN